MIYIGSVLKCIDNSGALTCRCLKIYKKTYKSRGEVGDILLVAIKSYRPNRKVKRGELYKAILMRTVHQVKRYGSTYISTDDKSIVLLDSRGLLLGTRVLGPGLREVRASQRVSNLLPLSTVLV